MPVSATSSNSSTAARALTDRPEASARGVESPSTVSVTAVDMPPTTGMVSIVIPVMDEEGNLPELYERLAESLSSLGRAWEIIFIDDGSTDATWNLISTLHEQDSRIIALRHRRNFGKAQALANGFAVARGTVILTMDGDLQDDPAEIPRMIEALDQGFDLVSGWKQDRKDPLGKTAPSKLFNWTVRKVTGVPLHDFNCGFKAYRREVTDTIRLYGELHRFTPVLAAAEGFNVTELPVKHHARHWGSSKYGLKRLVKGFLDLITVFYLTNYRQRPMHLFGLPGILALGLGVLIGLKLTWDRLGQDQQIGTRPLLLLAVLLVVVGTQFFALGLLGEFLAHGSNTEQPEPERYVRTALGMSSDRTTHRANTGDVLEASTPRDHP